MGTVFLVLQIVFDILAFIGYMILTIKIDDTHEYAEIDSGRIVCLEKQSAIFKDSIKLQNDSIRDVFDLTKFGIDINFLLPGTLVQVGIGPFCLYIVW